MEGMVFQDVPQPAVNNFQMPMSNGSKHKSNFIIPELNQISQEEDD
jgi:hypothetical protein